MIEKPSRLVPNEGTNGKESDKFAPSVFWITNPQNTFIGNVAAGGVDGGFWVEALERGIRKDLVQGHNINQPFDVFRDNVAHSHKVSFAMLNTNSLTSVSMDYSCIQKATAPAQGLSSKASNPIAIVQLGA